MESFGSKLCIPSISGPKVEVLRNDKFSDRLLSGLHYLQENGLLCDLTLVSGDNHATEVHRAVVAAASDYFQALLTLDMKEKGQKVISLKGVPYQGLQEVIKFAYTGQLCCSYENIADVLLAATHLQFTDAVHLCSRFLIGLTSLNNCVDMYNMAEQFSLTRLRDKALGLILRNFEDIAERDDFVRFHERFIIRVLADNRLNILSELQLFHVVLKWINHDPTERIKYTYQLMSHVRFPLIPPADLVEHVMVAPVMKSDQQCLELLLEANKYHMLPEKQPQMQTRRSQVRSDVPGIVIVDFESNSGVQVFDLLKRSWRALSCSNIETYQAQVCVLDNFMYVCGGMELYSSNNPVSAKCYRYDPRFETWTEIAGLYEPRHHFALVANGRSVWAIGGYAGGQYKGVVEQYSVRDESWHVKAPLEIRTTASAAAVCEGRIYLAGGQTEQGISRALWCYNIASDSWSIRAPMISCRMDHTMCCYGKRIYVIGGYDKNIIKAFDVNTVEMYNIEMNQWSKVFDNAPKISGIYSCLVDHCIYTVGGFTYDENKKRNEVWSYNIRSNEWQPVTKIATPTMSVPCCALFMPRQMQLDVTV